MCDNCLNSAGSPSYTPTSTFATFVQLKCFRRKTLFFANEKTYEYFYKMEIVFRQYLPYLKTHFDAKVFDLVTFFREKLQCIPCIVLKNCHNIQSKIMLRFIRFRLRSGNRKVQLPKKIYNSKIMAMHAIIR